MLDMCVLIVCKALMSLILINSLLAMTIDVPFEVARQMATFLIKRTFV
jgi:hypothetical protein